MRPVLAILAAAAIGTAVVPPAFAQGVVIDAPGVSVGIGNNGYYRGRAYDRDYYDEDVPRGGRSYSYSDDNGCRVEVIRERHWDGSTYTQRERHCD